LAFDVVETDVRSFRLCSKTGCKATCTVVQVVDDHFPLDFHVENMGDDGYLYLYQEKMVCTEKTEPDPKAHPSMPIFGCSLQHCYIS